MRSPHYRTLDYSDWVDEFRADYSQATETAHWEEYLATHRKQARPAHPTSTTLPILWAGTYHHPYRNAIPLTDARNHTSPITRGTRAMHQQLTPAWLIAVQIVVAHEADVYRVHLLS